MDKKELIYRVGDEIRKAREDKSWTQEKLAEKVNLTPQSISDIERGVMGPSLYTFYNLCVVLGVSGDQLLFGERDDARQGLVNSLEGLSREQVVTLGSVAQELQRLYQVRENSSDQEEN